MLDGMIGEGDGVIGMEIDGWMDGCCGDVGRDLYRKEFISM